MLDCFKLKLHTKERCVSVGTNKGDDIFTTAAFRKETKGVCVYCQEFHSPQCAKVTDVNARRSLLREFSHCFVCLNNAHVSKHL